MKNPSGKKLEKLVFGMFDQMVEGADKYVTKQGSTWLIFTESKKWVIEFTKDKTLWFNYNVFQNELDLIGKDCTEERDLIKDWFESRFLNKPKVEETKKRRLCPSPLVEDTIQNGVKEAHHVDVMKFFDKKMENTIENGVKDTSAKLFNISRDVEDTIQNGVKETIRFQETRKFKVEDTIQNGVKLIGKIGGDRYSIIEDTIQNGVKQMKRSYEGSRKQRTKDTVQNGVKHTEDGDWLDGDERFEDIIQNGVKRSIYRNEKDSKNIQEIVQEGVKETKTVDNSNFVDYAVEYMHRASLVSDIVQNGVKHTIAENPYAWRNVEGVIENGVKEVIELPELNPDLNGYGEYYSRNKNMKYPFTDIVEDVIKENNKLS